MRRSDGGGYTCKMFNDDIRTLLKSTFDYRDQRILSHSFRAGVPTVLARNGFSKEVIKAQGRWSSSAYRAYTKEGRGTRLKNQLEVAECLATEAMEPVEEILVEDE